MTPIADHAKASVMLDPASAPRSEARHTSRPVCAGCPRLAAGALTDTKIEQRRKPGGVVSGHQPSHYGARDRQKADAQLSAASPELFRPDPWCRQAGDTTMGGLFAARARIDAGEVAVIEGERRLTFGQLNERVNRLAKVLAGAGIGRGDRVGMLARNCAAWLELELAAA